MAPPPLPRVAFGSGQERKLFPLHFAPDRLGNRMQRQLAPHIGPGCYNNHQFGTIFHSLQTTPWSKRGYCARTGPRFLPANKEMVTPSPQQYQLDHSRSTLPPAAKAPFNSNTPRFRSRGRVQESPGPGMYHHDIQTNRKVNWPMCFGRPDWSKLDYKSHRVKLEDEDKLVKQRRREAYLRLYF